MRDFLIVFVGFLLNAGVILWLNETKDALILLLALAFGLTGITLIFKVFI